MRAVVYEKYGSPDVLRLKEVARVVEAVGKAVTRFAAGDEVFGVNADHFGAHAEFLCMREDAPLALKPAAMSFEDAAAVQLSQYFEADITTSSSTRWARAPFAAADAP